MNNSEAESFLIRIGECVLPFQTTKNRILDEMNGAIISFDTSGAKMIARAQRFPIQAVMQYRVGGEEKWYRGTVENISSTGVLFHAKHLADVNSLIEVSVNVFGGFAGGRGSKMVSRGKVVRLSPCGANPGCTMMAAVLYHLRIMRD